MNESHVIHMPESRPTHAQEISSIWMRQRIQTVTSHIWMTQISRIDKAQDMDFRATHKNESHVSNMTWSRPTHDRVMSNLWMRRGILTVTSHKWMTHIPQMNKAQQDMDFWSQTYERVKTYNRVCENDVHVPRVIICPKKHLCAFTHFTSTQNYQIHIMTNPKKKRISRICAETDVHYDALKGAWKNQDEQSGKL